MLNQLPQGHRIAEERFREITTSHKQFDQHFQRARVVNQKRRKFARIARPQHKSLKIDQQFVRIVHFGQQEQQAVQAFAGSPRLQKCFQAHSGPGRITKPEGCQPLDDRSDCGLVTIHQELQGIFHVNQSTKTSRILRSVCRPRIPKRTEPR